MPNPAISLMRQWANIPCDDQCIYESLTKTRGVQVTDACDKHTNVNWSYWSVPLHIGNFLLEKSPFAVFACVTGHFHITVTSHCGKKVIFFLSCEADILNSLFLPVMPIKKEL